jgi:Na+-translocating ferredoxin:NAD+ oxidoreductase RnfD subunit
MATHASAAAPAPALSIRGFPVLLPTIRDARLHLAAVIVSLQVLGQAAFGFRLSIAQILISLGTCAVLEVAIALWRQRVIMWPASALLTGNGVAFILRVPGTEHGQWWSLHGWWIFVATSAVALLSKHVIRLRGAHVFNPSNIGLVICFLALGSGRAEPLDFWWAPMSTWMVLALVIIVAGGLVILSRLHLLSIAVGFWLSFAAALGVLAATGHAMTASWHLGPVTGAYFWWVLVTSPEILVFLFFMITDPKTVPSGGRARVVFAVAVGLLAALLIAPAQTEFWSKVAVLGALAIVSALRPVLQRLPVRIALPRGRRLAISTAVAAAAVTGLIVVAGIPARPYATAAGPNSASSLPPITILRAKGVQSRLTPRVARQIARTALAAFPSRHVQRISVWLERGEGQDPPFAVASLDGVRVKLRERNGLFFVTSDVRGAGPTAPSALATDFGGVRLTDVAKQVGLDFRHGAFRFGVTNDVPAMMGGGLCWLDYDNDGWLDLFVVNSYSEGDIGRWMKRGGLPRSALFHNIRGRFVNVSRTSGAGLALRGQGCVAGDLNGDGFTDLYVTTASSDALLWNNGNGTFTEGARAAGVVSFGWHTGAAVGDVNGDGRLDLFVAGYTEEHGEIPGSDRGFPTNHLGVRDLLFLNEVNDERGRARFREVGVEAGLESTQFAHALGAVFSNLEGEDGLDLYVANDEDPNRLYVNVHWPGPLGFRFLERARSKGIDDSNAGMGIAADDYNGDGHPDLFVTNSRGQTHAAFRSTGTVFADARAGFAPALGKNLTGWGDSWADLDNDGKLDLVLANGEIPIKKLAKDARRVQVLQNLGNGVFANANALVGLDKLGPSNERGLAAADYDNDGRVDIAINSIGGRLILLRNTGPSGHWLEVRLGRFAPGAVVTAVLPGGRKLVREVHAGSSYLSSEDPRVHFGLGATTTVSELIVRYPGGTVTRVRNVRANRIVLAP